jgi:Holliday junction resolvasome RuvABC endonuclease subunit
VGAMGIDPSLRATGIATADNTTIVRSKATGVARLVDIRDQVRTRLDGIDFVAIEGYAFASQYNMAALGELGGVIRMALWNAGIRYIDIAPTKLKMYALGAGKGSKTDMVVAARDRLGYEGTDDNEADALWLYAIAADLLGMPVIKLPQTHRRALDGIRELYQ